MKLLEAAIAEDRVKKIIDKELKTISPVSPLLITQSELELVENKQKRINSGEKLLASNKLDLKKMEREIIVRLNQGATVEDGRIKAKHDVKEEIIGRVNWKELARQYAPQDKIDAAKARANSKKRRNIQLELFT